MSSHIYVSDASPLIFLAKLGKINLLQSIFNKIYVPEEVYNEVTQKKMSQFDPGIAGAVEVKNAGWIEVRKVKDKDLVKNLSQIIDDGEAEAIALAKEMGADLLIIDDYKGRREASNLNIQLTGTLGILLKAKEKKLIITIRPYILQLIHLQTGKKFRASAKLIVDVLEQAGEWDSKRDSIHRLQRAMLGGTHYTASA